MDYISGQTNMGKSCCFNRKKSQLMKGDEMIELKGYNFKTPKEIRGIYIPIINGC